LTLSIGVVELPAHDEFSLNAVLLSADRAMYRSKASGGNLVSVGTLAEPPLEPAPVTAPRLRGRGIRPSGAAIRP
jgi:hypothetical protein